ncbi:MAG: hypothetical protein AB8G15_13610 [Saprospiraceae bacterium]
MSALIIAIYIWLGGYFGVEQNAPALWQGYQLEQSNDRSPQTQNSVEWEYGGL